MSEPRQSEATLDPELIPRTKVSADGDWLVLTRRNGDGCSSLGMLAWLVGWTVGTLMLINIAIRTPDLKSIIGSIVFSFFWFVGLGIVLWLKYGYEQLRLGPEGADYLLHVLIPVRRRRATLSQIVRVHEPPVTNRSPSPSVVIELADGLKSIRLSSYIHRPERAWLLGLIQARLEELKAGHGMGAGPRLLSPSVLAASVPIPKSRHRFVAPPSEPPPRPENATAVIHEDETGITVICYSKQSWIILLIMLGFIVGWNGVMSVILIVGLAKWQCCMTLVAPLMLLPGLGLMRAVLLTIRKKLRGAALDINAETVVSDSDTLLFKPKPVETSRIKAVAVCDPTDGGDSCGADDLGMHNNVVFLDSQLDELLSFSVNRTDEAEWIVGRILHRYPELFDRTLCEGRLPADWWDKIDT